ncbi:hypothetical protein OAJ57_00735 [Alphaproteobacteria bacterium]|nr:hypothetical protein [Alphaproteobacteria bacterium]
MSKKMSNMIETELFGLIENGEVDRPEDPLVYLYYPSKFSISIALAIGFLIVNGMLGFLRAFTVSGASVIGPKE